MTRLEESRARRGARGGMVTLPLTQATSSKYLNSNSFDYLIITMMTRLEETAWGAVGTGPTAGWGATYRFGDDFLSSS